MPLPMAISVEAAGTRRQARFISGHFSIRLPMTLLLAAMARLTIAIAAGDELHRRAAAIWPSSR